MARTTDSRKPRLDPRLAERLARKKAQLDHYRPLPSDTVRRLNEDLRVFLTYHSNAIEGKHYASVLHATIVGRQEGTESGSVPSCLLVSWSFIAAVAPLFDRTANRAGRRVRSLL